MTQHLLSDPLQVQGRCPACNSASLFLADGGYITCSWIDCPNPDAAASLLEQGGATMHRNPATLKA